MFTGYLMGLRAYRRKFETAWGSPEKTRPAYSGGDAPCAEG